MQQHEQAQITVGKMIIGKPTIVATAIAVVVVGIFITLAFDVSFAPSRRVLALLGRDVPETAPTEQLTGEALWAEVVPAEGYTVNIKWGDIGKKLVAAGGIDLEKYVANYSDPQYAELLSYLTDEKDEGITITSENAYFWVNTLWALGLTQRSTVLDEGVMGTEHRDTLGNFASTAGWTLGARDAVDLYSSADIIPLTPEQQQIVAEISGNVYRPCCGNPTSFPDCNHGMAILALVELMVSQGYSEEEIYDASLAFNSYWFTTTYVDLAYYFQSKEGTAWESVDAKRALSAEFSSSPGYQAIKTQIGTVPGLPQQGASCGA